MRRNSRRMFFEMTSMRAIAKRRRKRKPEKTSGHTARRLQLAKRKKLNKDGDVPKRSKPHFLGYELAQDFMRTFTEARKKEIKIEADRLGDRSRSVATASRRHIEKRLGERPLSRRGRPAN